MTAAGVYELTPIKRHFRLQCHEKARPGLVFGLDRIGSSAGLMAMLVVLGVMSITWMTVIAIVVVAERSCPPGPSSMSRSRLRSSGSASSSSLPPSVPAGPFPPPVTCR